MQSDFNLFTFIESLSNSLSKFLFPSPSSDSKRIDLIFIVSIFNREFDEEKCQIAKI